MFDRAAVRRRGQGGFTLIEAVLSLVVVSIAILSIAAGLFTSARADNRTNEQLRGNLALATFTENLRYVPSGGAGCSSSDHAATLLANTLLEPEVGEWVDRGMVFAVTDVEYACWQVDAGDEDFTAPCNAPGPTSPDPSGQCPTTR